MNHDAVASVHVARRSAVEVIAPTSNPPGSEGLLRLPMPPPACLRPNEAPQPPGEPRMTAWCEFDGGGISLRSARRHSFSLWSLHDDWRPRDERGDTGLYSREEASSASQLPNQPSNNPPANARSLLRLEENPADESVPRASG